MKDLDKIKQIVEEETGIKDISCDCRDSEYISARAMYFIIAVTYFKDLGFNLNSKARENIAKVVGRKRLTISHAIKTFTENQAFSKDHETSQTLNKCKKRFFRSKEGVYTSRSEIIFLEEEVDKLSQEIADLKNDKTDIENWFSNFTVEQVEEIKPRIMAYMQLNKIAS